MAIYDRDKATYFTTSGGVVAPDRLTNEVEEQITGVPLTSITDAPPDVPDACRFDFDGTLDAGEQALLDSVCEAHSGIPMPEPGPDPTSHNVLIDVTENQHHPRLHADTHGEGQEDALALAPAQVGAGQAAFNASKLQGRVVNDHAPNADEVLTWDAAEGWMPKPSQGGGGYPESYYAASEGNSATTSTDDTPKVTMTETFDGGIYMLWWYVEAWNCSLYKHTRVKVKVDDEVVAWTDLVMEGSYNENPSAGIKGLMLDAGEHTIQITFARIEYCTVYTRRARLFVQKVGD